MSPARLSYRPFYFLFAALMMALAAAGCAEDVAAPTGVDEPFSMYGIINPRLTTQTLLVSPIEPLLYDFPNSIDAVVRSTDLETGETITWRDTVVTGERGQLDFVFMADFLAEFERAYRVEIARSDGAVTSAVAHVPERVEVSSGDRGTQFVDVFINGKDFRLHKADVVYTVRWWNGGDSNFCASPARSHSISYLKKIKETEDGYRFLIDLVLDHERVMALHSEEERIAWVPSRNGFALTALTIRLLVAEEAWDPPGGVFDENALGQPRTMSNVENGYGFVGGGYNQDRRIFPSTDAIDDTWFFDYIIRPPASCFDYCNCLGTGMTRGVR